MSGNAGGSLIGQTNFNPTQISNGVVPSEGPKAITVIVPFDTGTSFTLDLSLAIQQQKISVIQGFYFDNSDNNAVLSITVQTTGQVLELPPLSQGYVPLLAGQLPRLLLANSGGSSVKLQFLNVPVPALIWNATTAGGVVTALQGTNPWLVGQATGSNPWIVGGVYNSAPAAVVNAANAKLQLNSRGAALTDNTGVVPTYSAPSFFNPVASATDIQVLTGSNTKIIKIKRLDIMMTATAAGNQFINLFRRSTLNSGGSTSNLGIAERDTTNPSATASCFYYTANAASLGTQQAFFGSLFLPVTASASANSLPYTLNFNDQPLVLNSANESFCISAAGGILTGLLFSAQLIWTEQ